MTYLQSLILGLVQGITEFFPISSSGHLILIPEIFGWQQQSLTFDTVLHLGTAGALIVYFFKDIRAIFVDPEKKKLGLFILIGSIPAVVFGLLLDAFIESNLRSVSFVVLFLVIGSVLMWFAESRHPELVSGSISLEKSFIIGLFQALALLPGVSRSGSTISGGMFMGLTREKATRFSFLLSIPIVLGAGAYKALSSYEVLVLNNSFGILVIGFLASFISGLLAIKFLLNYVKNHRLYVFVIYRIVLVAILLILI